MMKKVQNLRERFSSQMIVKIFASIIIGLSIGYMITPELMTLPFLGSVSSIAVGGVGLVIGAVLYQKGPEFVGSGSSDCGCSGECGCS